MNSQFLLIINALMNIDCDLHLPPLNCSPIMEKGIYNMVIKTKVLVMTPGTQSPGKLEYVLLSLEKVWLSLSPVGLWKILLGVPCPSPLPLQQSIPSGAAPGLPLCLCG